MRSIAECHATIFEKFRLNSVESQRTRGFSLSSNTSYASLLMRRIEFALVLASQFRRNKLIPEPDAQIKNASVGPGGRRSAQP